MRNMKKEYIKPQIVSVSLEVKSYLMVVSGEGIMNARESVLDENFLEEEDIFLEEEEYDFKI